MTTPRPHPTMEVRRQLGLNGRTLVKVQCRVCGKERGSTAQVPDLEQRLVARLQRLSCD